LGDLRDLADRVHLDGNVLTKVLALISQDFGSHLDCNPIEPGSKKQQDLKSVRIY
jgi:hypothetical protein